MKELKRARFSYLFVLVFLMVPFFLPQSSSALRPLGDEDLSQTSPSAIVKETADNSEPGLQPINEKLLDDLSPSLVAPPKEESLPKQYNQIINQAFESSICFKRCHNKTDFHPSDNTAKQWRLLIDQDGHAIFGKIPWESSEQKQEILNYLINNARNTQPGSAGIGVW